MISFVSTYLLKQAAENVRDTADISFWPTLQSKREIHKDQMSYDYSERKKPIQ